MHKPIDSNAIIQNRLPSYFTEQSLPKHPYYIVLDYVTLYYTILCCTLLYYAMPYYTVLY